MPGIVKHSSFAIPHELIVLQYGHLSISTVQEMFFGKPRPNLADSGCWFYQAGFTSLHTHLRKFAACRAVLSAIVLGTKDDGGRLCEGGFICGLSVFPLRPWPTKLKGEMGRLVLHSCGAAGRRRKSALRAIFFSYLLSLSRV